MSGTDSYIQVPPDSTGKKTSTVQVTRADATVVEIQDMQARGLVTDTPSTLIDGDIQPLSLTPQGRLRVSTVQADIEKIWQSTWDNPWDDVADQWFVENLYA